MNQIGVLDFLQVGQRTHLQLLFFEETRQSGNAVQSTLISPNTQERFAFVLKFQDGKLGDSFVRCREAPPGLSWAYGELIAAFEAFGAVKKACAQHDGPSCISAMVDFADVTGDGRLTVAELTRVARSFIFLLSYLSKTSVIVAAQDLLGVVAVAGIFTPLLVKSVIEGIDYDGDGALSLEELLQDRGASAGAMAAVKAIEPAAIQATLKAALGVLGAYFERLPF